MHKDGFHVAHYISDGSSSSNYDVFFTAIYPCEVMFVSETHRVAGTDLGVVSLNMEKLTSGQALGAGVVLLQTGFDLKGAINSPVVKSGLDLSLVSHSRQLVQGDRLALKTTGTLTGVAGVQVTVYLKRLGKGDYL